MRETEILRGRNEDWDRMRESQRGRKRKEPEGEREKRVRDWNREWERKDRIINQTPYPKSIEYKLKEYIMYITIEYMK